MATLSQHPWFLALIGVLIAAEIVWRVLIAKRGYDLGAAAASLGIAAGNLIFKSVSRGLTFAALLAVYDLAPVKLPIGDWRIWLLAFLAVEFVYYWFHRWSHTIRWLWATHAVHHTASELTFPAALRLGWTDIVSGGWLLFIPLAGLGFPPAMIATLLAFNLGYQFLLHTEAIGTLGPLEGLFNTPAHHRIHHASNPEYLDKNFGGVLIVFDRLFGSFAQMRADVPLRYGVVHAVASKNPFVIAFHEWARMVKDLRAATSAGQRVRAMFGRPI